MKNLAIILTVCLLLGAFVSCTSADAEGLREVSVAEAVEELSAASSASVSLDFDDVTNIFNKVKEMYKTSDTVKLTDGEVIYTANIDNIDLAYAQSLNSSNNEVALEAYEKYMADVVAIALNMIETLIGEGAVVELEFDPLSNTPKPDALVALDLASSGAEDAFELHGIIKDNYSENGSVEYQDDILYVYGVDVLAYKLDEVNSTPLFPTQEEGKIVYALRNPSSGNVVQ